jgi:hypothetical protein
MRPLARITSRTSRKSQRYQPANLGRTATRILLDWIRSQSRDLRTVNQRVFLPTEFVIRCSCECEVVRRTGSDSGSAVPGELIVSNWLENKRKALFVE